MPPAVIAAAPPAAAKLDLRNDRRSRSSVSLKFRWCNSNSGQFLSSPAHMFYLPVFQKSCLQEELLQEELLQEKLLQGKLMQKGCRAEPHLGNDQEDILIEARSRDSASPDGLRHEFFEAAVPRTGERATSYRAWTDVILL